ncbi:MAG: hydroxyacid dehydrogenase [Clostridia bacterium]|nr:hydroxyacid dehydrogenase [Clostridia bacterium]
MKITILDRDTLGSDTPISVLSEIGELTVYDKTAPEQLIERCKESEILVLNKVKITREAMLSAKKLRLICVFATGYDNIDVKSARELGIAVTNVPGYSSDSVALFTVSTVLALVSHLFEYSSFVKRGEYQRFGTPNRLIPVYHELRGKTWGIIGYGGIGQAVAKIAEAFGARVIVNKRTETDAVKCVDIDTLCHESDIISVHCPLNDATRSLISRDRINLMKDGVILVNEARGSVLNESDVRDAVLSGKIAGFGSDVYSVEPFPNDHPYNDIMGLDNVILTPHAAWGAYEARERCINIILDNIKAFNRGEMQNRVDK